VEVGALDMLTTADVDGVVIQPPTSTTSDSEIVATMPDTSMLDATLTIGVA